MAILDGPVDLSHPALSTATVSYVEPALKVTAGAAGSHGTAVASLILGNGVGGAEGIAPGARGLLLPIFGEEPDGSMVGCSQVDLARSITLALQQGAEVINISGGQFTARAEASELLAQALRRCRDAGALVVAAAGNQGCDCLLVPAALEGVLAVGAMDTIGRPLPTTNWGAAYSTNGILAPGKDLLAATPGGGVVARTGTSYATAVVSGLVALLASADRQRHGAVDLLRIRAALLNTARACADVEEGEACQRLLRGRIDLPRAIAALSGERRLMESSTSPTISEAGSPLDSRRPGVAAAEIQAAEGCSCKKTDGNAEAMPSKPQYVYAIGRLAYDFPTRARQDSLQMAADPLRIPREREKDEVRYLPLTDPSNLVRHLRGWNEVWAGHPDRSHPPRRHDAKAVTWLLMLDAVPIYAIQPFGPYAEAAYDELIDFLIAQEGVTLEVRGGQPVPPEPMVRRAERVAMSGTVVGKMTLSTRETVPVLVPDMRGTAAWDTASLGQELKAAVPGLDNMRITEIVLRLTEEARNLGLDPADRARNYMATNVYLAGVATMAINDPKWDFDILNVTKSPLCRPESDCYDVELSFFNPENLNQARRVVVWTIDVSDVVPVAIGQPRVFNRR